ncbi:HD domain-containing protein [Candidatus Woesearchaeota archaeon]|nr:HD domain-containing protein [Candidatus Woesearchaeota archaeon]
MKNVLSFLFESLQLKRVKRSGWWIAKVKDPETVAEHSFGATITGYMLAKKENVDEEKVIKMCMLQDFPEARLNDLHKVGHRYIDFRKHETEAFTEQVQNLDPDMRDEMSALFNEYQEQKTPEAIVARDADLLECLIQAKEYIDSGYKDAENWLKNSGPLLRTKTAKKIFEQLRSTDSNIWWRGLKKVDR